VGDVEDPDRSLVLRLHGSADDIQGEARIGKEPSRRFTSWIEMVALIERWRAEPGQPHEPPAPDADQE